MRKKIIALCLAAALVGSLVACTTNKKSSEENTTQIANPNQYDISSEEVAEKAQVDLIAPEGAENVKYNLIGADEEHPIAEIEFTLDGKNYYERAVVSSLIDFTIEDPTTDFDKVIEASNISGINGQWSSTAEAEVKGFKGVKAGSTDGSFVAWFDTDQGILYNLCTSEYIEDESIVDVANHIFTILSELENSKSFDDVMSAISEVNAGSAGASERAVEAGKTLIYYIVYSDDETTSVDFKEEASKWFDTKDSSVREGFTDNLGAVTEIMTSLDDEIIYDPVYEELIEGVTEAIENK